MLKLSHYPTTVAPGRSAVRRRETDRPANCARVNYSGPEIFGMTYPVRRPRQIAKVSNLARPFLFKPALSSISKGVDYLCARLLTQALVP